MHTDPRSTLIAAARLFYQQGWMVGAAGNLSARLSDGSFWITTRNCAKHELTEQDFIRVALDGTVLHRFSAEAYPSSETSIHRLIYSLFPKAQACYHVHSIEDSLVSHFTVGDDLPLPSLEMLRRLGVSEEHLQVAMPVFTNHARMGRITNEVRDRLMQNPPTVPALLIRNHGVTVWAPSPTEALNYLELVEQIFRYMVQAHQIGIRV